MLGRIKKEDKLKKNQELINNLADKFKDCEDLVCQKIVSKNANIELYKIYFNGLINVQNIDDNVLKPISRIIDELQNTTELMEYIKSGKIYHLDIKIETNLDTIVSKLLEANFILVCENQAYIFESKGFDKRALNEPESENIAKGAKDCFIEVATTNVSLIRRRIQTSDLKVINKDVGKTTTTKVSMVYVEGIADPEVVQEIERRIQSIDIPSVVCPADFEEHMVERKFSVFPQAITTERPDKAAANIIEGKIVVIVDGFPSVYIFPAVFAMFMQAPEEYGTNYFIGSFIRCLRYVAVVVSMLLPALYIAVTTFHQEMLPTTLAKSIITSKQNVPIPAFLEIIIMLLAFEVLLEAGARMPKTAGQTVSIVGALIVGEAAVNAKFVSPAVVVIVAASAICSFVVPSKDMSNSLRICRLGLVVVSSIAGLYGIAMAIICCLYYLCGLESCGMPYLKPFVNSNGKHILDDTLIRGTINKKKNKMVRW